MFVVWVFLDGKMLEHQLCEFGVVFWWWRTFTVCSVQPESAHSTTYTAVAVYCVSFHRIWSTLQTKKNNTMSTVEKWSASIVNQLNTGTSEIRMRRTIIIVSRVSISFFVVSLFRLLTRQLESMP